MSDGPQKFAVVTGAGRGIGEAIARRLDQGGYIVWAIGRDKHRLEILKNSLGGRILPLQVDLSNSDEVISAAEIILKRGTPEVLVNNAGISDGTPLDRLDLKILDHVFAVNFKAPTILSREIVPRMARMGHGRVINIASTAGIKGFKYGSAYCGSKHALIGLTRALAIEYAAGGFTINAICPGWTDTDMLRSHSASMTRGRNDAEQSPLEKFGRLNPMRRLINVEDIAELGWFLASSHAGTITGSIYMIDAGEST
jgi:NAD(P)-dependent dehydrogenase (short-subunit alcohol dehydrogenase family)